MIDVNVNVNVNDGVQDAGKKTKIVGDVDFDDVKDIVSAITPVPEELDYDYCNTS